MGEFDKAALPAEGRVIMVTGTNRGIGRAVARRLYAEGYTLSLSGRDPDKLREIHGDIEGDRVSLHRWDALDKPTAAAWLEATLTRHGRVDGLVNNAGLLNLTDIEDGDEDGLDRMWAVNVKGPFRLTNLVLPHLRKTGTGRVVNVASLAGLRYKGGPAGYSMTKFAAMSLTHATRVRGWEDGVRACAICPGPVNTEMVAGRFPMDPETMTQPDSVALLVATALAMPNQASVAFIPVNATLEWTL